MWLLLLLLHSLVHIQPVKLQDNFRVLLRGSKDNNPCEGRVEVFYNGKPGYVGDKYWNSSTEDVVCRSTHCGTPVKDSTIDVRRPLKSKVWLNELNCTGTERNLWDCKDWPGPGVSTYRKPTVKKIKCSNEIKISLKQHKCEGAVQYSINGISKGYICSDGFGKKEAEELCKSLNCGSFKEHPLHHWMTDDEFQQKGKMKLSCLGIGDYTNLWQCVSGEVQSCKPASVTCEHHRKLQLSGEKSNVCSGKLQKFEKGAWKPLKIKANEVNNSCNQMHCGTHDDFNETDGYLTCADQVKIVLTNNKTKCYGEVNININGHNKPVCASSWTERESEKVCRELNCGKLVRNETRMKQVSGIMDHVKCEHDETSLWHCRAQHGKNLRCSSVPYVVCSDSIDEKLVDGPGKCSGKLEIQDEGQWKPVSNVGWTSKHADFFCNKLECGNKSRASTVEYKKGATNLLQLNCVPNNGSSIGECIDRGRTNPGDKSGNPVGITCEKHKVVFLDGPKVCSGSVGIQQGDRTFWLSGSNDTWNKKAADLVCQQMNCGNASNFSKNKTPGSYCSSDENFLFECKTNDTDNSQTIAHVTCQGDILVGLTDHCWGWVNVSVGGKSGDVCADTWTFDMSNKLCEEQGCGEAIQKEYNEENTRATKFLFKSFQARRNNTSLSRYSFVKKEDNRCEHKPVFVVCKGSVKPGFVASRDSCSGNIEIEYKGKKLPVCSESLNNAGTRNTICQELNCGQTGQVIEYFGPRPVGPFIKIQTCSGNFSTCDFSEELLNTRCEAGALQCSDWRKMALEGSSACEGEVTIYSKNSPEDKRILVSSQGWTDDEGQRLCKDMNCGNFMEKKSLMLTEAENPWNKTFNCSGKEKSIWECEKDLVPTNREKLRIKCNESKVQLSHRCAGELKINGYPVCSNQWHIDYSHMVCQELDCGNAVEMPFEGSAVSPRVSYYHVHCEEHNYILGQCKRVRVHGNCQKPVTITCTRSVSFITTEKCGGQILIQYPTKSEKLCDRDVAERLSKGLCHQHGCDAKDIKIEPPQKKQNTLACPKYYRDLRYCVKNASCESSDPYSIYCGGYIKPLKPTSTKTNPVLYIVGVGIFLILVLMIVIFVRYRIVMRKRKSREASNMQEAEWESGEYDDIDQSDEHKDINRDRFRSESEFMREKEVESLASFSYDDIDEVTEAQPLTSPDVVNHEVADAQENYEDINENPEIEQTTADDHDRPETTPGSEASPPPDMMQKEELHLVPGQDG